jgi:hypothetical protein
MNLQEYVKHGAADYSAFLFLRHAAAVMSLMRREGKFNESGIACLMKDEGRADFRK